MGQWLVKLLFVLPIRLDATLLGWRVILRGGGCQLPDFEDMANHESVELRRLSFEFCELYG
jgi:hypothetical protein